MKKKQTPKIQRHPKMMTIRDRVGETGWSDNTPEPCLKFHIAMKCEICSTYINLSKRCICESFVHVNKHKHSEMLNSPLNFIKNQIYTKRRDGYLFGIDWESAGGTQMNTKFVCESIENSTSMDLVLNQLTLSSHRKTHTTHSTHIFGVAIALCLRRFVIFLVYLCAFECFDVSACNFFRIGLRELFFGTLESIFWWRVGEVDKVETTLRVELNTSAMNVRRMKKKKLERRTKSKRRSSVNEWINGSGYLRSGMRITAAVFKLLTLN